MKRFNLFMPIFMAILLTLITTTLILWILFTFEESNLGWGMLTFVSLVGYMSAALYIHKYKKTKEIG